MNKTKIPWADYTINPVKGLCPMACSYCYARKMYKRFKWNPEIRWDGEAMYAQQYVLERIKPSRIFVGSTFELFGNFIRDEYVEEIFHWTGRFPQHTFIFLTKQPQNLIKWSPFPENCWVGVSATTGQQLYNAWDYLFCVHAKVKFFSFEPLLTRMTGNLNNMFSFAGINWLIIGSLTATSQTVGEMKALYPQLTVIRTGSKYALHPPREWVDEIITAADQAPIPVFIKEPMASYYNIHRQEFPLKEIGE